MINKYKNLIVWMLLSSPFFGAMIFMGIEYIRFILPICFIACMIIFIIKNIISLRMALISYMILFVFLVSDIILMLFQGNSFDLKTINLFTFDSLFAGIVQFPLYAILLFLSFIFIFYSVKFLLKLLTQELINKKNKINIFYIIILLVLPSSFSFFLNKVVVNQIYNSYLANNVKLPETKINAKAGKNLILIYLESFETEYVEKKFFPTLTPFLHKFNNQSTVLEENYMIDGANYSIAGMFASQCGAPYQYRHTKNLICLGDILNEAKYKQIFMQGSDMSFEHMGDFYTDHHYSELYGKKVLKPIGSKDKLNSWGLTDEDLFEYAFDKWKKLEKSYKKNHQHYNLTLFTSDTHNGEPSKGCPKYKGLYEENHFFQSYHCSDYLLEKFIGKIENFVTKNNLTTDDLVIALIGDHLQHFDAYASKLNKMNRRVYISLHNSLKENNNIKLHTDHTDFSPTLLDYMGVKHNAHFLFGKNILDKSNQKNKIDIDTIENKEKKLHRMINASTWIESIGFIKEKKKKYKKREIKDLYSFGAGIKNISKEEIKKYFLPELESYKNFSTKGNKVYYSVDDNILFIKTKKLFNDINLTFSTKENYFYNGKISASKAMELDNYWYVWVFKNKIKEVENLHIDINEVTQDKIFRERVIIQKNKKSIVFKVKLKRKHIKMAFYVYRNNKRIDTQWYSKRFSYTLDIEKYGKGIYQIRYFTVDESSKDPAKSIKIDGYSDSVVVK